MNRKGFASVLLLFLVVVLVIAIGMGLWYFTHRNAVGVETSSGQFNPIGTPSGIEKAVFETDSYITTTTSAGAADYYQQEGLYVYNLSTHTTSILLQTTSDTFGAFQFGNYIYMGDGSSSYLMDLTGKTVGEINLPNQVQGAGTNFSPDYKRLIYAENTTSTGHVEDIYNTLTGKVAPISLNEFCDVFGWSVDSAIAYCNPYSEATSVEAINTITAVTSYIPVNISLPYYTGNLYPNGSYFYPQQNLLIQNYESCLLVMCPDSPPGEIQLENTLTGTSTLLAYSKNGFTLLDAFIPATGEIIYSVGLKTFVTNLSDIASKKQILNENTGIDSVDASGEHIIATTCQKIFDTSSPCGMGDASSTTYLENIDGTDPVKLFDDSDYTANFIGWFY